MTTEVAVRARDVAPGDYLPGLGRVQSINHSGGPAPRRRVTLFSEGDDWRVSLNPRSEVVVIRQAPAPKDKLPSEEAR